MKIGDRVRVIGVPANLPANADGGLDTADLFRRCLGRVFPIVAFDPFGQAELHVGELNGRKSYMELIWIEPEFLIVIASRG